MAFFLLRLAGGAFLAASMTLWYPFQWAGIGGAVTVPLVVGCNRTRFAATPTTTLPPAAARPCLPARLTLQRPTPIGGAPSSPSWTSPPPPQIKVTIAGKNEIYKRENLIGPFLVQTFGSQTPPPPPLPLC